MDLPLEKSVRRSGLHSVRRAGLARREWNLVTSAWLLVVLGVFAWIRVWHSEAVMQLVQKLVRH